MSKQDLLTFGTINILGQVIFCCGSCPVHQNVQQHHHLDFQMLVSLYTPSLSHGKQKCPQTLPGLSWGMKLFQTENHCARFWQKFECIRSHSFLRKAYHFVGKKDLLKSHSSLPNLNQIVIIIRNFTQHDNLKIIHVS